MMSHLLIISINSSSSFSSKSANIHFLVAISVLIKNVPKFSIPFFVPKRVLSKLFTDRENDEYVEDIDSNEAW
jgi:hypothetical protein